MRKLMFILCLIMLPAVMSGRDTLATGPVTHLVGINFRQALVFQSWDFLKGTNAAAKPVSSSTSAHLQYAFRFSSDSRLGMLYPSAYQGIGISSYTFYNHKEVGSPLAFYVFQGATIARLSETLTLDYEWNFGVSFGWHPYDEVKNPLNTVVGSSVNACINAGLQLSWIPLPSWKFSAGLDLTHFSNGHTSLPNAGINTAGLRIGASRIFNPQPKEVRPFEYAPSGKKLFSERLACDLTLYGTLKSYALKYNEIGYFADGNFAVVGFSVNPLYEFSRFFMAGVALDVNYDESANLSSHVAGVNGNGDIRFYRQPLKETLSAGLSLRAELVMPIFSINFGVGHNFLYSGDELGGFYQSVTLKTFVTGKLYINVGYQFRNFKDPDNLQLGLGWRLGSNPRRP